MNRLLIILIALLLPRLAYSSQSELEGYWVLPDGAAVVEVFADKEKDEWSVSIVALRETLFTEADGNELAGNPRTDIHHPDPGQHQRSLVGLEIGSGFEKQDDRLTGGTIYDPGSGKRYKAELEMTNGGLIKVRGYIGIAAFGRTMYWFPLDEYRKRTEEMLRRVEVNP